MADFRVERGTVVIAALASTATITEGVDYSVGDASKAWIRITSTGLSSSGSTTGGVPQAPNAFASWVSNPGNLGTSITFERESSAGTDTRIEWELVEYQGVAGGPNEVKVRDQGELSFVLMSIMDVTPATPFSDVGQALVLITGQGGGRAGGFAHVQLFTAEALVGGDIRIQRGIVEYDAWASWVALEFTGSNWRAVQRFIFSSTDHGATPWTVSNPGNSGTWAIPTALLDASKAFAVVQFRNAYTLARGINDFGENVELTTSLTHVTTRRSDAEAFGFMEKMVVWIVENTQSGAGAMSVEHVAFYESDTTGPEEKTRTLTISGVGNIADASIWGECSSVLGGGSQTPRGWANVRLMTPTTVGVTRSDTGKEERWSFDVVQWPSSAEPVEVTPGPAGLLLSPREPVVQVAQSVTPGPAGLLLSPAAPVVQVAQSITPGPAGLSLSPISPVVQIAQSVTPGPAGLVLAPLAPVAKVGQHVQPAPAGLLLGALAPVVKTGVGVAPSPAALLISPISPVAKVAPHLHPSPAGLELVAIAPVVVVGGGGGLVCALHLRSRRVLSAPYTVVRVLGPSGPVRRVLEVVAPTRVVRVLGPAAPVARVIAFELIVPC